MLTMEVAAATGSLGMPDSIEPAADTVGGKNEV